MLTHLVLMKPRTDLSDADRSLLIGRASCHGRVDFGEDGRHLGRGLPHRDRRE